MQYEVLAHALLVVLAYGCKETMTKCDHVATLSTTAIIAMRGDINNRKKKR